MICLNVSPFKCNGPQTDGKRSAAIPPLLSFFSATKERGDEEKGACDARRKREAKKKESYINLGRIENDREESEKDRAGK